MLIYDERYHNETLPNQENLTIIIKLAFWNVLLLFKGLCSGALSISQCPVHYHLNFFPNFKQVRISFYIWKSEFAFVEVLWEFFVQIIFVRYLYFLNYLINFTIILQETLFQKQHCSVGFAFFIWNAHSDCGKE